MNTTFNLALLGAGYWGKNLARVFHSLGVLKIICDKSPIILDQNRALYPDIHTTSDFEDVLENPDINAVAIATPSELHYSLARKALAAGKHLYVEKPLALTRDQGQELTLLAKAQGKVLFVGHILQYHPALKKIKEMLHKGELGRLQYVYSHRLSLGKIRREENILWSFAPHDISVILSLVNEEPNFITAIGNSFLHPKLEDTTCTHLKFPSGVGAHIFVSWLHPFKEHKLVIVGDRQMVVFDDTAPINSKIILFPHKIFWKNGTPIPEKKDGIAIDLQENWEEPLLTECKAFLDAINGKPYVTDGDESVRVLSVLEKAQQSLGLKTEEPTAKDDFFVHESSYVDSGCDIGSGTKIWHFSHILKNSTIGKNCNIGQNVVIGPNGKIGNNVKVQNSVSIYDGVLLEDNVFCGPSCVFTNVINPRSAISRKNEYNTTLIRTGATIGANATILCGITIGKHAFIGAGAVVTNDVPDYALVYGNPGKIQGWVNEAGQKTPKPELTP
ncbi:MAG: Gfo/Idh/MocA family oxidoreductase [Nitrospinales bacterium]